MDPDPESSSKARAVFALGLVGLLTGPFVGGLIPATLAIVLARQAARQAYQARGYLTGSGLREYDATGRVCGIALPEGLEDGSRLPEPIFTPATKAALGDHDENVSYDVVVGVVGAAEADRLRTLTLQVYETAEKVARRRGILVADTKLEFGARPDGTVVLADEVLTPDSSRFWWADDWLPGRTQPSLDKDIVRTWLTSPQSGWDRTSGEPPPSLPESIVERTRARYIEAYERLTGESF